MVRVGQCYGHREVTSMPHRVFMEDQGCDQVSCTGLSHSPYLSELAKLSLPE